MDKIAIAIAVGVGAFLVGTGYLIASLIGNEPDSVYCDSHSTDNGDNYDDLDNCDDYDDCDDLDSEE